LDQLPRGYSGYDEYSRQALAAQGIDIPGDVERNRRIDSAEERRIVEVLRRRAEAAPNAEERVEAEALGLMFELALCTAMRMRAIYTLTEDQISLLKKTVFLQKTKNGKSGGAGYVGCGHVYRMALGRDVLSQLRIFFATKEHVVYFTPANTTIPGKARAREPASSP
jgi:hypothetical protein